MKTSIISIFFLFLAFRLVAQIGINTDSPNKSSILDISAKDKGILLPRTSDPTKISNPANGLIVYDTVRNCISHYVKDAWKCVENSGNQGVKYTEDFFYAPPFVIDLDSLTASDDKIYNIDIYEKYQKTFTNPKAKSPSAPTFTTYYKDQLGFIVTDYDPESFSDVSIDDDGILSFKKLLSYNTFKSFITVVFKIK